MEDKQSELDNFKQEIEKKEDEIMVKNTQSKEATSDMGTNP